MPNPHLETPHYKVQRLRHDELNAMEHVPASYEMVEQPEEPKAEDATGEAKRERPEAAVKGIVPDQPAPIVPEHRPQPAAQAPVRIEAPRPVPATAEAEPQSGFMSKILGWFKTDKQEVPAANDAVRSTREPRRDQQQQRERRPDQRHSGGERGNEPRRDHRRDRPRDEQRGGDQRRQQQGAERRPDQRHGGQQQRDHRPVGERRPDQQRPQQQQRPPRPEQAQQPQQPQQQTPRAAEPALASEREGEEQRRGRRSRRDRHRDRRPDQAGEQRPPQGLSVAEHDANAPVPPFLAKVPDANELRAREREMHLAQMREEAQQREESAARESARQEAARQESASQEPSRQEPAREEPVYAQPAPAPQPAPVRVDPREILESAGLQMVETNAAKARQPAIEPEPVQLGRPRREKAATQPTAEDLVQIETRNK